MRHVTFRKVYGYRDPHGGVEEIGVPDYHQLVQDFLTAHRRAAESRFASVFGYEYEIMGGIRVFCMPLPDSESEHRQRERSAKRRPVTKRSIATAFGLTAAGQQQQLQNILDKVKKHL